MKIRSRGAATEVKATQAGLAKALWKLKDFIDVLVTKHDALCRRVDELQKWSHEPKDVVSPLEFDRLEARVKALEARLAEPSDPRPRTT